MSRGVGHQWKTAHLESDNTKHRYLIICVRLLGNSTRIECSFTSSSLRRFPSHKNDETPMCTFATLTVLCIVVAVVEADILGSTSGNTSAPELTVDAIDVPPTAHTAEPAFKFGTPTFFGSGCPADTVTVVPSTDGQAVSVLFSQFAARTSGADVTRERKSCNLAVPVDVQSGISIGIFRVDYRGNAFVPTQRGSYGQFDAEYYFAGQRGPIASEKYSPGTDKDLFISHEVGVSAVVWTPCGASTNFRVNSAITAMKKADTKEDTQIAIDSVDSTVQAGFRYFLTTRKCSTQ